jgi:hypothetical protein
MRARVTLLRLSPPFRVRPGALFPFLFLLRYVRGIKEARSFFIILFFVERSECIYVLALSPSSSSWLILANIKSIR